MTDHAVPPAGTGYKTWRQIGLWAVLAGTAGLALVFVHILVPMLQATPTAGEQIGAIALPFVWWVVLVVAAVAVLIAILQNIGDIFSF